MIQPFQTLISHWGKVECLDISNAVNTRVAEFIKYQSHGWYNHLFSARSAIKLNLKSYSLIEVF